MCCVQERMITLHFAGGAIVPVATLPCSSHTVIILGAEKQRSRLGRTFLLWDAMGGRAELQETVEETAAREFLEESLGVVQLLTVCNKPIASTVGAVALALAKKQYLARVDMRSSSVVYTTFFVRAAWDATVPARFAQLRHQLCALHAQHKQLRRLDEPFVTDEPEALPRPNAVIHDNMHVQTIHSCAIMTEGASSRCICSAVAADGFCLHESAACVDKRSVYPVCMSLRVIKDSCEFDIVRCIAVQDIRAVRTYLEWTRQLQRLSAMIRELPASVASHPCLTPEFDVHMEYLEKHALGFFSAPQTLNAFGIPPRRSGESAFLPQRTRAVMCTRLQNALVALISKDAELL